MSLKFKERRKGRETNKQINYRWKERKCWKRRSTQIIEREKETDIQPDKQTDRKASKWADRGQKEKKAEV